MATIYAKYIRNHEILDLRKSPGGMAAIATNGTATLATNLEAGNIAIVKIGDYSIKIVVK